MHLDTTIIFTMICAMMCVLLQYRHYTAISYKYKYFSNCKIQIQSFSLYLKYKIHHKYFKYNYKYLKFKTHKTQLHQCVHAHSINTFTLYYCSLFTISALTINTLLFHIHVYLHFTPL